MASSPYIKVYVQSNNRDITEMVENLNYQNVIDKDNLLTLKIKSDFALTATDDDDIISGKKLLVQFGLLGEIISPVHVVQISDVATDYAERVSLSVKCLDLGRQMKKGTKSTIWSGTASSIATRIAAIYSLTTDYIEPTTKTYTSYPQGNKTDFELLQDLAQKEGNFSFSINDNELHFQKVDYTVKAKYLFTYGLDMVSFKAEYKDSQQAGGASALSKGFNPMEKKPLDGEGKPKGNGLGEWDANGAPLNDFTKNLSSTAGNPLASNTAGLSEGSYSVKSLVGGEKGEGGAGGNSIQDLTHDTRREVVPFQDQGELNAHATKVQSSSGSPHKNKGGGAKILTGTLTLPLTPLITVRDLITIKGVAKRHQGNWYVESVTHDVPSSGVAKTTCVMHKTGTAKPIAIGATHVTGANETVGEKRRYWDVNGSRIKKIGG